MESYSVFHYTVLFAAPDTHGACLWVTVLADAQPKHLLWPCHSHWGMKLRCWHLDITAINTVNCISGLPFLLSFNINLIGIYLKENPLLVRLFTALFPPPHILSAFLRAKRQSGSFIKSISPILAFLDFMGQDLGGTVNYENGALKSFG